MLRSEREFSQLQYTDVRGENRPSMNEIRMNEYKIHDVIHEISFFGLQTTTL